MVNPTVSELREIQVTDRPGGHILTNANVWSPDGAWLVYDTRSNPAGDKFDGSTIEVVHVDTGEVREIYRSRHGACCGVATFSPAANRSSAANRSPAVDSTPAANRIAFILGPENPTDDWRYAASHRQGVVVDLAQSGVAQSRAAQPGVAVPLDARDLTPPFTPGALRGGSHVHVFDGAGEWVSFTYDDHVLETCDATGGPPHDRNQRNVGVSVPVRAVVVPKTHPRNHDGSAFSVLVTQTVNDPQPGSDEISRACEDAWVGTHGYLRTDGTRQRRAIAFQGHVVTASGQTIAEAYIVDLPEDVTLAGDSPLEGTATTRPAPPGGTVQRRLTFTAEREHPGLQGPRHWLRSSPDGSQIALLMRDSVGVVQLWTISPNGGEPRQITRNPFPVASALSWSPDGQRIAFVADQGVFVTDVSTGISTRLTPRAESASAPSALACVFSPDGSRIAYVRPVASGGQVWNQVFVAMCES